MSSLGVLTIRYDPTQLDISQINIAQLSDYVNMTIEASDTELSQENLEFNFEPIELDNGSGMLQFQLMFTNPL